MSIDNLDERIKIMVGKDRAQKKATGWAKPKTAKIVQLDFWEDGNRATSNGDDKQSGS